MALQSELFSDDPQLEAAALSDSSHITWGAVGPHVTKIQMALNELDNARIGTDGVYGSNTAQAVFNFKKKRGIKNYRGEIDNIVGRNTIVALDQALPRRQGPPRLMPLDEPVVRFIDFVIRFRGGAPRDAKANLDPAKLAVHAGKSNRRLYTISKSADIGNQSLIHAVVAEINTVLSQPNVQQGIICINGNSAGARNVLELASALNGKRAIKFVGCADAALFPDLPGLNEPEPLNPLDVTGGKAKNIPFWTGAPTFQAEIKQNFFQTADNFWSRRNKALRREWTGRLGDSFREIHGKITGFDQGGGMQINVPPGTALTLGAHVFAGDEGDRRNGETISRLLTEL